MAVSLPIFTFLLLLQKSFCRGRLNFSSPAVLLCGPFFPCWSAVLPSYCRWLGILLPPSYWVRPGWLWNKIRGCTWLPDCNREVSRDSQLGCRDICSTPLELHNFSNQEMIFCTIHYTQNEFVSCNLQSRMSIKM